MPPRGRKGLTVRLSVCSMSMPSFVALIKALTVTVTQRTPLPPVPSIRDLWTRLDDRYGQMDEADQKSVWYKPTEKAKEYRAYERDMREKMYSEIAERCGEYDRKHKNKDLGTIRRCEPMAAKYQLITELYRRTGRDVTRNPQAWQGFLSSACRNYKCRFDEQLLIYAQRPDAIAVAEIGTWNRLFKGWVNKDSKGIAVFDPKGRRNTLKYYFDVSDTHEGYYGSRPVPIWQMDKRYEQPVMERLADRFGGTEGSDFAIS